MEPLGTTPDHDPRQHRHRRPKVAGTLVAVLLAASALAAGAAARSGDGTHPPDQARDVESGAEGAPLPELSGIAGPELATARPVVGGQLSGQAPDASGSDLPEFAATGFVLKRGRFTSIEVPEASGAIPAGPNARLSGTTVAGTNDRGQVVGSYVRDGTSSAFLWEDGEYTTIDVPGAASTGLVDINNRGQMLGSNTDRQGKTHGFIREQGRRGRRGRGRITTLDVPGAAITAPHKMNDRGHVAGNYTAMDEVGLPVRNGHGFLWDDGEYTTFDVPYEGPLTDPQGINNRGVVVGAYDDPKGVTHGFLRTRNGRFRTIDVPGAGPLTSPLNINDRGAIVGQYADRTSGGGHGFLLRDGRITDIDVPGAPLTLPTDIDRRGTVVGFSYRPVQPS